MLLAMPRSLLALLLGALLALPASAGATAPRGPGQRAADVLPVVGIADQKPSTFFDPRFASLGIRTARVAVAWDAMTSDWQVAELDRWMFAARLARVDPLVTFQASRVPGRRRWLPTPAQFVAQLRAFRARYPWIRTFSTWNEANHCGWGPCHHPEIVARWWKALSAACPGCKVLGADLLDMPNMTTWVRGFVRAARRQPRYWGVHNYVSANRFQTASTERLLGVTTGQIWFTETGGLVARRNASTTKLPQGRQHAAKVTRFVFRTLARLSPRIARVYLYQWSSTSSNDTWDSAFVGPDGRARPSLMILKQILETPVPPARSAPPKGGPVKPAGGKAKPAAPGSSSRPAERRAARRAPR